MTDMQNERPPTDEQVLRSWCYAILFAFFVTVPLWLIAGLWVGVRDDGYPSVGDMLVMWAFTFIVLTLAIRWGSRRR